MRYGRYFTIDTQATDSELAKVRTLGSIAQSVEEVDECFYITDEAKLEKFHYLRGPKKIQRTTVDGHEWTYSEGGMAPFDDFNLPGRTMLTSEGSVNRSTHFLKIGEHYRLITPIEAERLNDFPSDWTRYKLHDGEKVEVSDHMRYFFMGNALVTSIIKRIGDELQEIITMDDVKKEE
ncbi:DNA cytosine methyltransferase [Lysinibacillus sp. TE18511]